MALVVLLLLSGCDRTEAEQRGPRGLGVVQLTDSGRVAEALARNRVPEPEPRDPPDPELPLASAIHANVQVLGDLNVLDFSRLMQAVSNWVAPEAGCVYCHNVENLASDEKYTKVVARAMFRMTRHINTEWKTHVAGTGVTCWTCHRGKAVPSGTWFTDPGPPAPAQAALRFAGQNRGLQQQIGNAALPFDPLSPFLGAERQVAVQALTALAPDDRPATKRSEWTYALMMYISKSLGVNCTYCHNTRAMGRWEESSPQRVTAWYGIRMVRELNDAYLTPLKPVYPAQRLGTQGDAPKVGCETCHKGTFKPLLGVSMLGDYPELAGIGGAKGTPGGGPTAPSLSQSLSQPDPAAPGAR